MVREGPHGGFAASVEERPLDSLPDGELLVRVHFSSLNYKDALSGTGNRGVTREYPHTPGIDAAGVVEQLSDEVALCHRRIDELVRDNNSLKEMMKSFEPENEISPDE